MKTIVSILLFFVVLWSASCSSNSIQEADLIVTNANIWTGNEEQKSANAMAIIGDSIFAIGTNKEIEKFKGEETEIVNAAGAFITPGFTDTHLHFSPGGVSLLSLKLGDVKSREELGKRFAEYTKTIEPGTWVLEGNWDETKWGGELPTKEWIDEYSQENPVVVFRIDGHTVLANSLAMKISGIDENTADVEGGIIIRNEDGSLTGIFKDKAMSLFDKVPELTEIEEINAFNASMNYLSSNGVTSVHDMNGVNESYRVAKMFRDSGNLSVRIYAGSPLNTWNELLSMDRTNDKWLKIGCLKGFIDGSLGSHTAAFQEAYTDNPHDHGLFTVSTTDLYQSVSDADNQNLQVMIHAIGDSAINKVLDIYDRVIKEHGVKDRRFRIEHAQHILPSDIKRFADLGVIASMQPYHAIDDGRWAEELIGPERAKSSYAFKSLLDANAIITFGSDWPVAPATPLEGIYAAVTRRTLDGKNPNGWVPEQKITVEQALIAYTKSAAYASFDEKIKGTLEPGKLADFVLISEDLTKVDPVRIKDLKIMATYVGGKKVFERK